MTPRACSTGYFSPDAIGVGPRTVPDIIYHVTILIVLAWGLGVTARARPDAGGQTR